MSTMTTDSILTAVRKALKRLFPASFSSANRDLEPHGEKDAAWYDRSFESADHWKHHYTASRYYFLWTVIADRITLSGSQSILDVGCGSGQLAALLRDKGIRRYCGIDFSSKRLAHARTICPEFEFVETDAFATDLFDTFDYDTVLSTEFLEHVEEDTKIIERVRLGSRFLGTVPNFPFTSHVRHFANTDEVATRYAPYFSNFRIDQFFADDTGTTFFLISGVRS